MDCRRAGLLLLVTSLISAASTFAILLTFETVDFPFASYLFFVVTLVIVSMLTFFGAINPKFAALATPLLGFFVLLILYLSEMLFLGEVESLVSKLYGLLVLMQVLAIFFAPVWLACAYTFLKSENPLSKTEKVIAAGLFLTLILLLLAAVFGTRYYQHSEEENREKADALAANITDDAVTLAATDVEAALQKCNAIQTLSYPLNYESYKVGAFGTCQGAVASVAGLETCLRIMSVDGEYGGFSTYAFCMDRYVDSILSLASKDADAALQKCNELASSPNEYASFTDSCYYNVAKGSGDKNQCYLIQEESLRAQCLNEVG